MPRSEVHKKKFKTNVAIFLVVMAFCALIWAITVVRISSGAP